MALFVGVAIAFVLAGAIGIHIRPGGRYVGFFVGLLALVSGLMMLYLAYLTTTDDFGR